MPGDVLSNKAGYICADCTFAPTISLAGARRTIHSQQLGVQKLELVVSAVPVPVLASIALSARRTTMPTVSPNDSGIIAALFAIIVLLDFAPTLIAYGRRHRHRRAILILNLLTGWTVIGWVISAVWSTTPNVDTPATHTWDILRITDLHVSIPEAGPRVWDHRCLPKPRCERKAHTCAKPIYQ